ncbi:hypothetical protein FRC07_003433 [Ceratobasidium sp. 392]|nr:hypothetical protein FRC07_003433 [Ceratobasidium sp. 392]
MLDDAAPRGWSFHESFTTAYHEPASTRIPLHEDTFTEAGASAFPSSQTTTDLPAEPSRAVDTRPSFSIEDRDVPHLPPISPPENQVGQVVEEVWLHWDHPCRATHPPQLYQLLAKYPASRHTWEHDRRSSSKRSHAQVDGTTDRRRSPPYSSSTHLPPYLEIKGKRKMMSSQSPAFRLDNLLESSPVDAPRPAARESPAISGYELPPYDPPPPESAHVRAPSMPVFGGKLPPTPFTGSSTLSTTAHTGIASLGISVSGDLNLGGFAVADDFERDLFGSAGISGLGASSSQSDSFAGPSRLPAVPGSKPARKLPPTAPRRKSRGVFPHDDVPLVISSSTTKQSRYRPSGDRQPVACGYKDPITQVQCDEPFNRPVELRRHVRAVHVPAEALAVTMGQLSRSQATLLPNDWKPGDGDVLRPTCVCGKVFSRLDALRRHWTGVNAKVADGKCIECPSSLAKKK